jgi:hypothetical protein
VLHLLGTQKGGAKTATNGEIKVWAQNGTLCAVDQRTGEFFQVSIEDAIERTLAIWGTLRESQRRGMGQLPQLDRVRRKFAEDLEAVIAEAKAQGAPMDAEANRAKLRARTSIFSLGSQSRSRPTQLAPMGANLVDRRGAYISRAGS